MNQWQSIESGERGVAQFWFEIGYAACYAETYIQSGEKFPFELHDELIERAFVNSIECYDDPAEIDRYKALADAASQSPSSPVEGLVEALEEIAFGKSFGGPDAEVKMADRARAALSQYRGE